MADNNPYNVIASFYDDAGFSNYAGAMAGRLVTFLHEQGWLGRRVLDLGCGTGMSAAIFAARSMEVLCMDNSPAMLEVAAQRMLGTEYLVTLIEQDIRQGPYPDELDMIFCMGNVLNEIMSQRELEAIFQHCYTALNPGKMLVFDLSTIHGLVEYFGNKEHMLDISDRLFVAVVNSFNYEGIAVQQRLTAFRRDAMDEQAWNRSDAAISMRGYPYANIIRVLEKIGFSILASVDSQLHSFDPNRDMEGRFIVIAQKPGGE
jgi:SAM-dependent methyltransferase